MAQGKAAIRYGHIISSAKQQTEGYTNSVAVRCVGKFIYRKQTDIGSNCAFGDELEKLIHMRMKVSAGECRYHIVYRITRVGLSASRCQFPWQRQVLISCARGRYLAEQCNNSFPDKG